MKKYLLVCFLAISGSGSFASTVQSVNLSLRVDEAKYNGVTVEEFNDNQEILRTSYFSSLSLIDAKKYNPPWIQTSSATVDLKAAISSARAS